MAEAVRRVLRRAAAVAGAAVMLTAAGAVGATPASAVNYYYELPYPADEAYLVTQGPEGTYSHVGP